MKNADKMQFNEMLRERTMNLAAEVRNHLKDLEITTIDRSIITQLIRSSSSVAANYRSATRGRSDAEFYSKICITVEEADETLFWIDYLIKVNVLNVVDVNNIRNEIDELVRLFSSVKRKMKEKLDMKEGASN
jgi:four helix bundle protein